MNEQLNVSSTPHVRSKVSTSMIMLTVIIALLPACGFGVYNFGYRAFIILATCVLSAVIFETLFNVITKCKNSIFDLSAVVTGLLLGMNLPASVPYWIPVIGSFFAIIVVKMLFGGLGQNFMNPALGARCFLLISFSKIMTNFDVGAYSGATPLANLKNGETPILKDMVFGNTAGTIGETSMIAIVIGACILIMCGVIDLYIAGTYIATFGLFIYFSSGFDYSTVCMHLAGGGLMLGAFFMATDYATSPKTKKGQFIYGIFLGVLTAIFRLYGPSAEGVSYAIIIGNLIVPLIDKITKPKPFGFGKERA